MSRRRGFGAGLVLLVTLAALAGCADVAASPSGSASSPTATSPSRTATTSTPTRAPSPTPSQTVSSTQTTKPTQTPTTKPSSSPTQTPKPKPTAKAASKALQVERKLESFGYPVGTIDGTITKRARQALCAWRETHGLPVSRGKLTQRDIDSILAANGRPKPTRDNGIYVNKTCQVLYQIVDSAYKRIVWVSTGSPGYETPNGTGKVWRKWAGGHESSLYEDAWMYDSIYFRKDRPGIALHGSATNRLVYTYPASHGCIRVWRPDIHQIFRETPIGRTVVVYGKY